jgi:predicted histidine transporter YuiF (NhaC family)
VTPDATPDATYWGRYRGRWRQCFLVLAAIGFVVVVAQRLGEVHNVTNALRLGLDGLVGGIGDGLLLGSLICFVVAVPRRRGETL